MKIAQIGCGYWGPNLLRGLCKLTNVEVAGVLELSQSRQQFIKTNFANVKILSSLDEVLSDSSIDAVVVATPAETHYEIAKQALQKQKHVFVEKPLATNEVHAQELVNLADQFHRIIMVGHVFLYNDAVRWIFKEGLRELGPLYYGYSQRLNLGRIRQDVNVWWNLACHDISIFLYLMENQLPQKISVNGSCFLQPGIEDIAFANLIWENGFHASIHVSWLDPTKKRSVTLVGSEKMLIFDDLAKDKIELCDKSIKKKKTDQMDYDKQVDSAFLHHNGKKVFPEIEMFEPIVNELMDFVKAIETNRKPIADGENGLRVVKILEAGEKSLKENGKEIWIPSIESTLV